MGRALSSKPNEGVLGHKLQQAQALHRSEILGDRGLPPMHPIARSFTLHTTNIYLNINSTHIKILLAPPMPIKYLLHIRCNTIITFKNYLKIAIEIIASTEV